MNESSNPKESSFLARIVEVHKGRVFLCPESQDGIMDPKDVWLGTLSKKLFLGEKVERNILVVGDRVFCQPLSEVSKDGLPHGLVLEKLPRESQIARKDPIHSHLTHILASNVTQLVIVSSYLAPRVKWGLIDRYLILAREQGLKAAILLNKKDLLEKSKTAFQETCSEQERLYKSLGYTVLSCHASRPSPSTLKTIKDLFQGEISILSGHSGVGKSSILNLASPLIEQDVDKEHILTKGRHTTTYASLIPLEEGGIVIDTPGIRSFELAPRSAMDLAQGFVEFVPFLSQCHYKGRCRHNEEPQCAIKEAVAQARISPRRYASYLGLLLGTTGREGRLRETRVKRRVWRNT